MKIKDLKDKERVEKIDLKIIWDQSVPKDVFGNGMMIKQVIVADANSTQGDPTAYLDLVGKNIQKYKHMDVIRVENAYAKKIKFSTQFRITNVKNMEKLGEVNKDEPPELLSKKLHEDIPEHNPSTIKNMESNRSDR